MKNLNLSGQARWLRGVALAISNAKMRVNPRMTPTSTACDLGFTLLRMCAVFCILFTIGVGNVWGEHTKVKAGDIVSGEKYIITATYNSNTYYLVPGNISTSTNRGTYTSDLTEAAAWTFTSVTGGWTITTIVDGDLYYLFNGSSSANSVASYSDEEDPLVYTITATTTGATTVYINGNTRYIALYTGGSNWRAYSSTSQANSQATIQLYRVASSTFTVTYDGNEKTSGSVPTDATAYNSGATVTVKGNTGSLARTGYSFGGWNTKADGSGTNYTAGSGTFTITANTTLYAKWNPNQYTVTWVVNGSTVRTDSNVNHGSSVTPPTVNPLPCGDKLAGWTDAAGGNYTHNTSTLYSGATIPITSDVTLYAVFADEE